MPPVIRSISVIVFGVRRRTDLLLALIILLAMSACVDKSVTETRTNIENYPRLLDDRLTLSLFAEDPDIVTPIGIAVDSLEQIFVLESHTHTPPRDYSGPDSDRIKMFIDENADGKPEKISVFAEGFREGVNITFSPKGNLYVVTSQAVYVLYDHDGDGKSEKRKVVLELTEPEQVYAHAALLGITFSSDGWMYVSRGNTGSAAWKLKGSDGTFVSGYGDGGNIVRARPDGSGLHEIATGFWNPADLKFDAHGRLLAADNDPDSRGPNRLVHVVDGGDYGYKSLYGGSGIHPYCSWNGELPGTLPYAVALGEAPSGLLDASLTALPKDYHTQMLASIWEEQRIVRIDLVPKGASVTGKAEVIVEGTEEFRPVAFAVGPAGDIYFTDWVLRKYPNHGRGRVWKLTAKVREKEHRKAFDETLRDPERERLRRIGSSEDIKSLLHAMQSEDQFYRHTAVIALSRLKDTDVIEKILGEADPNLRLGAMLAMQRSGYAKPQPYIRELLKDADQRVRMQALRWVGREGLMEMQPDLYTCLLAGPVSPRLFETYLETLMHLDTSFVTAYKNRDEPYSKSIERSLPEGFLENFIRDNTRPPALRALALKHLDNPQQQDLFSSLLAKDQHPTLRLEAARALARTAGREDTMHLLRIAEDATNPVTLRAEALVSLMWKTDNFRGRVSALLKDESEDVRIEAARYIRTRLSAAEAAEVFRQAEVLPLEEDENNPFTEQISIPLYKAKGDTPFRKLPASGEAWQRAMRQDGNAARGRRVFYSPASSCSSCHTVGGQGGDLGPDLSKVALSKTRSQLVAAITDPSKKITPEYQGWFIKLVNGEVFQGRQIDIGENGIELYTYPEGFQLFEKAEIADYGMITTSLMPEGLEHDLTLSDIRDLLAFLEAEAGL